MVVSSSPQENRIGNVLLCFSIYTNTKAIFNTKMDDSIAIIHGMKFLGMVWIIMAHTALYTLDYLGKWKKKSSYCNFYCNSFFITYITRITRLFCYCIDNKIWTLRVTTGLPIQILANASISVDTYFFISGFLVAYLYLKNVTNKQRNKSFNYRAKLNEFFVYVMRRYIRYVLFIILRNADNKQRQ